MGRPRLDARSALRLAMATAAASLALWPAVVWAQVSGSQTPSPERAPDKFMIAAFDVTGATKLTNAEIEKLIYPFVGPDRSNDDVIAAREALQDAYAAKGYSAVLVDVPVQPNETFSQGIVQIAVNETPLGRVRVVDAKYHSLSVVRAQVPSLVEGQPVNLNTLQREVAVANRFPDRTIDPTFRAGQVPGTIDIDLKVTDDAPYHASVDLNNDNSPNTKPLRLTGTVRYTNLWDLGHTLQATYVVAPQARSQSEVFSGSYIAPLIGTPWSFSIFGYTSNSNVAALGGTNVLGDGTQIGLRAIYRLPSDNLSQTISFGPNFNAFQQQIFVDGDPDRPSPIHYIPLVAEYAASGGDEKTSFGLTLGATAGLRVVRRLQCIDPNDAKVPYLGTTCIRDNDGDGLIEDQFQKVIDGRENFVHLNLDANYSMTVPGDAVLALRFSGQLSDSPLVVNEQFAVGGMTNVRGYYASEAVGDNGFVESVEVRSPDLSPRLGDFVDELRLFTFGDVGYAKIRRAALQQQSLFRIGSVGGGARLQLFKYLSGEVLIGVPAVDGPVSRRGDPRYSFSLKGEF